MPVVPAREIMDRAFAERYGVAAINIVNDLTLEAVLAAATELESPLIVQTSVKTVKAVGAGRAVRDVARPRRRGAGPGRRCTSTTARSASGSSICLRDGLELGAVRRARELDVEENPRQTIEVVAEARRLRRARRGRDRGRSLGVEDGVGSDEAGDVHPVEVVGRVHRGDRRGRRSRRRSATRTACTGARRRSTPSASPTSSSAPDPDGAARRHRHDATTQFSDLIAPRLREGQHLHRAEDRAT